MVKDYAACIALGLAFQSICGGAGPWDTHFKDLVHDGVIIVSHTSDGTDFGDVEFAIRREDVIRHMDMFDAAKDDVDCAHGGVSGRTNAG